MRVTFLKLLCCFSITILVGCIDCSYEQSLEDYKDLSTERLSKLYTQMDKIFSESSGFYLSKEEADKLYPEIADLNYKHIDPINKLILIGGCFDNKLIMKFGGLSKSQDKNENITISWGEHPLKIEKLWQK